MLNTAHATAVLSIERLEVSIGSAQILRRISLEVAAGAITGLIGRNGAGKTTLMKSIMGLLKTDGGAIRFGDTDLLAVPAYLRARLGIGYMPEDRRLVAALSAEENILVPAWAAGAPDMQVRRERIYEAMPELRELARRKGRQLSGGQQKLVALARAMMCGTRLLLLDEPFEGVAPALAQRLAEVIAAQKSQGMAVLVSASDLQHSERLVDRTVTIDRGTVASVTASMADSPMERPQP